MNLINYKNLLIVLLTIFTTSISHSFEPILHIDNKKQTTKSGIDYHMHYASYGLITKELSHDVKYQADIVLYTLDEWKTIYGFHFKMHKKAMMTKEDADGEISKSSETVALQNKNPVRIGRDAADMLFDKEELFENYFGLFDMKDNKWKFVKLAENKNKKKGIKYLNEDKNNFREWIYLDTKFIDNIEQHKLKVSASALKDKQSELVDDYSLVNYITHDERRLITSVQKNQYLALPNNPDYRKHYQKAK